MVSNNIINFNQFLTSELVKSFDENPKQRNEIFYKVFLFLTDIFIDSYVSQIFD
jgi:hypothetical protein